MTKNLIDDELDREVARLAGRSRARARAPRGRESARAYLAATSPDLKQEAEAAPPSCHIHRARDLAHRRGARVLPRPGCGSRGLATPVVALPPRRPCVAERLEA